MEWGGHTCFGGAAMTGLGWAPGDAAGRSEPPERAGLRSWCCGAWLVPSNVGAEGGHNGGDTSFVMRKPLL